VNSGRWYQPMVYLLLSTGLKQVKIAIHLKQTGQHSNDIPIADLSLVEVDQKRLDRINKDKPILICRMHRPSGF
jgi:hypothetical protein